MESKDQSLGPGDLVEVIPSDSFVQMFLFGAWIGQVGSVLGVCSCIKDDELSIWQVDFDDRMPVNCFPRHMLKKIWGTPENSTKLHKEKVCEPA